jgi:hypothetical protein
LTFKYHDGLLGIYRVTFSVPDDLVLPVLAHKDDKGQLCFPLGQNIEGWATSIEIDHARAHAELRHVAQSSLIAATTSARANRR